MLLDTSFAKIRLGIMNKPMEFKSCISFSESIAWLLVKSVKKSGLLTMFIPYTKLINSMESIEKTVSETKINPARNTSRVLMLASFNEIAMFFGSDAN